MNAKILWEAAAELRAEANICFKLADAIDAILKEYQADLNKTIVDETISGRTKVFDEEKDLPKASNLEG